MILTACSLVKFVIYNLITTCLQVDKDFWPGLMIR
nr:MAG TPA: hypothetical protein [Caudoviricetes sp.]